MSTYSQIYIHIIFAVKNRTCLISAKWENELYMYITGIIQNNGQKLLVINGMPDHIHILIGIKPTCQLSELIREIKKSSNVFINKKGFSSFKFEWQLGYGAFSCSHSALPNVIRYIQNQKEHHRIKSFTEEYKNILLTNKINLDRRYLCHSDSCL